MKRTRVMNTCNMSNQAQQLIGKNLRRACEQGDTNYYTHVTLARPFGRWIIDRKNWTSFFDEYEDLIVNPSGNGTCCIAEKPQAWSMVVCDIDHSSEDASMHKLYDEDEVFLVAGMYVPRGYEGMF